MKNYDGILFDFDYTLVDSSKGIVLCAQHAFEHMGFRIKSDDILDAIGMPLPEKYHHLTGDSEAQGGHRFRQLFMQKQPDVMTDNTHLFPGVADALEGFSSKGVSLGIVSTKTSAPIHELLQRESLSHHFDCVIGGEHVSTHKPDPEGIYLALEALALSAHNAVLIGDSIYDAGAAKNAGIDFIASLTGKTSRSAFEAFPKVGALDALQDIFELQTV